MFTIAKTATLALGLVALSLSSVGCLSADADADDDASAGEAVEAFQLSRVRIGVGPIVNVPRLPPLVGGCWPGPADGNPLPPANINGSARVPSDGHATGCTCGHGCTCGGHCGCGGAAGCSGRCSCGH